VVKQFSNSDVVLEEPKALLTCQVRLKHEYFSFNSTQIEEIDAKGKESCEMTQSEESKVAGAFMKTSTV